MMDAMSYYPGPTKDDAIRILTNQFDGKIKLLAANAESQRVIDEIDENISFINQKIKEINDQIKFACRSEDFEIAANLKKQRKI